LYIHSVRWKFGSECVLLISMTCSKIEHIPYNLIFTTKCNDSSIRAPDKLRFLHYENE